MTEKLIMWVAIVFLAIVCLDQASKYSIAAAERDALKRVVDNGEHCVDTCADLFQEWGC